MNGLVYIPKTVTVIPYIRLQPVTQVESETSYLGKTKQQSTLEVLDRRRINAGNSSKSSGYYNLQDLKTIAKNLGIKGVTNKSKNWLVEQILQMLPPEA